MTRMRHQTAIMTAILLRQCKWASTQSTSAPCMLNADATNCRHILRYLPGHLFPTPVTLPGVYCQWRSSCLPCQRCLTPFRAAQPRCTTLFHLARFYAITCARAVLSACRISSTHAMMCQQVRLILPIVCRQGTPATCLCRLSRFLLLLQKPSSVAS